MDKVAQFSVVTTVGDGTLERRIGALAKQASRFTAVPFFASGIAALGAYWALQTFSAHGAE
jgi:hypothetical protein